MRLEWRWAAAIVVALVIGVSCASAYARLATPFYRVIVSLIAAAHPWRVVDVRVSGDNSSPGTVVLLVGEVRVHRDDPNPAAIVEGRVQTGAAIETPLVFWTLLLMWPARSDGRRWAARVALGVPIFLLLEAATTPCQLVYVMARASAMLAGASDPLTGWEYWSRFLDAGGHFALEVAAALVTVAALRAPRTPLPDVLAGRPC